MRKPSQIPHEGRAKDDVKKNFQLFSGRQPNFSWVSIFFTFYGFSFTFSLNLSICLPLTFFLLISILLPDLLTTSYELPQTWWTSTGLHIQRCSHLYESISFHHLAFGPIAMLRRFAYLATSATQLYYDWKQSSRCRWKYLNCDQLSCWLEHLQDADWFFPRLGLEKLRAPWEEVFYPDFLAHDLLTLSKTGGWYCQRSQQGAWGAWWRGNHNHQ